LKKLADPVIAVDDLGPIDYILLSHDQHSDNLDRAGREMLTRAGQVLTTKDGTERLGKKMPSVSFRGRRFPCPHRAAAHS
jgi:L-ascorbate metabolism protein UlaG (beta-lactamase superfamily)